MTISNCGADPPSAEEQQESGGGEHDAEAVGDQLSEFVLKLKDWHLQEKGEELRAPVFSKKELDLEKLWEAVQEFGGSEKVCVDKRWAAIGRVFDPPKNMTNLSFHIKRLFEKYLLPYERAKFPDRAMTEDNEQANACKKRAPGDDYYQLDPHLMQPVRVAAPPAATDGICASTPHSQLQITRNGSESLPVPHILPIRPLPFTSSVLGTRNGPVPAVKPLKPVIISAKPIEELVGANGNQNRREASPADPVDEKGSGEDSFQRISAAKDLAVEATNGIHAGGSGSGTGNGSGSDDANDSAQRFEEWKRRKPGDKEKRAVEKNGSMGGRIPSVLAPSRTLDTPAPIVHHPSLPKPTPRLAINGQMPKGARDPNPFPDLIKKFMHEMKISHQNEVAKLKKELEEVRRRVGDCQVAQRVAEAVAEESRRCFHVLIQSIGGAGLRGNETTYKKNGAISMHEDCEPNAKRQKTIEQY